jgi:hypothetical protein
VRFGLDIAQHQLTWNEILTRAKLAEGPPPSNATVIRS